MSAAGRRRTLRFACLALLGGASIGVLHAPAAASALARPAPRARASIVGGTEASIASFPFQVALFEPIAGPLAGFFCGGVIVDATHVLTAAHCLAGAGQGNRVVGDEIEVLAGATNLASPGAGSVRDPAAAVSIDPGYDPRTDADDVGVITLARPLWPGALAPRPNGVDTIAPLALEPAAAALLATPATAPATPSTTLAPSSATSATTSATLATPATAPATLATVSGWGDTSAVPSHAQSYRSTLQSARVPLVPERLCAEEYAPIEQRITPGMICAGSSQPPADSCYGDSGGPLVVDRDTPARPPEDYVLVGLVDFGAGCAEPGFAGVYTRISAPAVAGYLSSGIAVGARGAIAPSDRGRKRPRRHRPARAHPPARVSA
ncbi:MAG TPA: serine protease [Solirubrobacteraceae bacterium]|nr:serine protease [Solirubrobacteraceae bacterium]